MTHEKQSMDLTIKEGIVQIHLPSITFLFSISFGWLVLRFICLFHLLDWSGCPIVNGNNTHERASECFLCYENGKESHKIWTRAESAGVSRNDECWLDLHTLTHTHGHGFGCSAMISDSVRVYFRPVFFLFFFFSLFTFVSSGYSVHMCVSECFVCMVLALTCYLIGYVEKKQKWACVCALWVYRVNCATSLHLFSWIIDNFFLLSVFGCIFLWPLFRILCVKLCEFC